MKNFYDVVLDVLKQDNRFVADDGSFLRNAVYEATMKMDESLIKLLLSNEQTAARFFVEVAGVKVFDKQGFAWLINNRQFLPDSYTRFKNKIGLVDEYGDMISSTGKVELVFPYKDCVLEGGQTKEDQKRKEVFYNETLAPDEIDRLLYPKVMVNAKKYTKDGVEYVKEFKDNDNLIIKGNNLLALSSLLKRYEGRVKCIYIDPPYYFLDNKSVDTFGYNSNFKLSTWLNFMKDRLCIARRLLSKDGSIWVSVGKDGQHYLKVLMDEIFSPEKFVGDVSWQKTYSPRNDAHGMSSEVESILVYSSYENWQPKKLPRNAKMDAVYKNPDNDINGRWRNSDAFAPSAATHQGMVYAIQHPYTGELIYPYSGACWPLEQSSEDPDKDTMLTEMNKWANYKLEDIDDDEKRAEICGIDKTAIRKEVKAIMLAEPLESAKEKVISIYKKGNWPKFFFTRNGEGGIARKTYLANASGKVVTNLYCRGFNGDILS